MNTMQHFAQKTVRYFSYIDEMMHDGTEYIDKSGYSMYNLVK